MPAIFDDLFDHLRLADLLDVAIVAVLLYVTLVWVRDRASRSLGIVTIGLASLFLLARWLDLYLTTMVFHYGLVGILLAMIVIFQHDIRHGFERLTSSAWFRRSPLHEPSDQVVDAICDAAAIMADQHIGALMIIAGREALNRHLRGGVAVDAIISKHLLISIFHPKSPGHDGAILIERNRLAWLGLHLPLTTRVAKLVDGGTRHAAALGLAECCDAMAIAVSEERGTISIATNGEIEVIDPSELRERLKAFVDDKQNTKSHRSTNVVSDITTKLVAVVAALTLWFLFAYRTDTVERTLVVPVEYRNLPVELQIDEPKPAYAETTLSGSEQSFDLLNPDQIVVSLEFENTNERRVFRWQTRAHLRGLPQELSVRRIVPDSIVVSVRPMPSE